MKKIAFLFPGQGSQYAGMAKELHDHYAEVRELFEKASQALGFDMRKLCFEGSAEELKKTENTQPAILLASVSACRIYMKEIGILPQLAAGHSLGEISALCCAGALDFTDAIHIVRLRGKLMQEAVPVGMGGMAAVTGIDADIIERECGNVSNQQQIVVVSNYNAPGQTVISGDLESIREAGERLQKRGAAIIPLKVSAPFHSPLMQPCVDRFRQELMKYEYHDPAFPVLSNVTGLPYPGRETIADYLVKQIVNPVLWVDSMDYLQKQGVDVAIEMGPQSVLKKLMVHNTHAVKAYSFDDNNDVDTIKRILSTDEASEEGNDGMNIVIRCIAAAVSTKNANWDQDEYRNGVVSPYKKLVSMMENAQQSGAGIDMQQAQNAVVLLQTILDTKKLPDDDKARIIDQVNC